MSFRPFDAPRLISNYMDIFLKIFADGAGHNTGAKHNT